MCFTYHKLLFAWLFAVHHVFGLRSSVTSVSSFKLQGALCPAAAVCSVMFECLTLAIAYM